MKGSEKIKVLSSQELQQLKGGEAISTTGWFLISGAVVFIAGIIDGILRPLKCNS